MTGYDRAILRCLSLAMLAIFMGLVNAMTIHSVVVNRIATQVLVACMGVLVVGFAILVWRR